MNWRPVIAYRAPKNSMERVPSKREITNPHLEIVYLINQETIYRKTTYQGKVEFVL